MIVSGGEEPAPGLPPLAIVIAPTATQFRFATNAWIWLSTSRHTNTAYLPGRMTNDAALITALK